MRPIVRSPLLPPYSSFLVLVRAQFASSRIVGVPGVIIILISWYSSFFPVLIIIMLIATQFQPVITARVASEKPTHDVSALAVNLVIVVVAAKSRWCVMVMVKVTVAAKSIEIGELIWSHIAQVGRPGLWQSVYGGHNEENLGWLHATEEFKCAKNIGN